MTDFVCDAATKRTQGTRAVAEKATFEFGRKDLLTTAFMTTGFARIRGLIRPEVVNHLRREITLLMPQAKRKDFLMPQTANSPRHMTVLGGQVMNAHHEIMALYSSPWILKELIDITGMRATVCNDPIENVIATTLTEPGDTHGWHTDDYPLALILVVEAPPADCGGHVELRRQGNEIEKVHLDAGDGYVLRSDRILHRVAPLTKPSRRTILNFTYSVEGLRVTPNGTAPLLCGDAASLQL